MGQRTITTRILAVAVAVATVLGSGTALARAELVDRAPSTGGAPVLATPNGAAASELAAELSVAAIAAPTPSSEPMSSLVADQEAFLRMADYVSPDGRQLRHGDVAISTTGPVSRQHP